MMAGLLYLGPATMWAEDAAPDLDGAAVDGSKSEHVVQEAHVRPRQ